MLTGIVKATRAHYAALQHRPGDGRVGLNYNVETRDGEQLTAGTIWVKVGRAGHRRAHVTRLMNRLHVMYPEAQMIAIAYRE